MGKDITRFHVDHLAGDARRRRGLPLPERVWGHGFVLLGGERFSKSAGVRLDLDEAIDRYGADAFRYFLLREVPFDGDGNFSLGAVRGALQRRPRERVGNLASRAIAMVEKYCDGVVPAGAAHDAGRRATPPTSTAYHAAMDGTRGFLLHEALQRAWRASRAATSTCSARRRGRWRRTRRERADARQRRSRR